VHQKSDSVRPSDSAVLEHQLPALQAELDKQRRCRIDQLDELTVDATEAVATGDESRLQVTRVLQVAAESAVGEINAALERLENGSYGVCERCTEPIPFERLEVLPMTPLAPRASTSPSRAGPAPGGLATPCPSAGSGDRGP
jgi:DnaK suppressor protein